FAACLALAMAAGIEPPTGVELASAAAAVAVGKRGTATCTVDELLATVSGGPVAPDREALARRVALEKRRGRRIVFTNGCFDILHSGHVAYLEQARALGDVLVVAVNGDESVRRLKGPGRPVNALPDRLEVLSALASVDYVVSFDEDSPQALIEALRPDVVAKGGDYSEETLPEAELVRGMGGEVRILPFVADRSTTRIIERIGARHEPTPAGVGPGAS
ncbi:MAG TPA: D-glycero-beta-D-manno-heptose 1-phosphate adenylyltransferase, partial [Candidatus Limnocylindria bacterium]|nr:D-glycero-beta-D-manno-heptose 1-phosphate adenylyltransferase [Candidatus Limnocylindria bacterium]